MDNCDTVVVIFQREEYTKIKDIIKILVNKFTFINLFVPIYLTL